MGLAVGMKHPVEDALRADIETPIRQGRHNLARRQRRELRLVVVEQDPLALFLTQAVGHMAGAASAAVHAVPYTCELMPSALQSGESHAKQFGELGSPCAGRRSGIEDPKSLPPVRGAGQPSASSEQKASHFFEASAMPPSPPWPSPCAAASC